MYTLGINMDHLKTGKMAGWVKCWLCNPELSSDPRGTDKARHGECTSVTPALRSDGRWKQENAFKLWGNQPGIHHNDPVADKVGGQGTSIGGYPRASTQAHTEKIV